MSVFFLNYCHFLFLWRTWLVTELLSFKFWISRHFNTTFRNKGKIHNALYPQPTDVLEKKTHLFMSCHGLSKSSTFYAIIWKLNFGVNLVTSLTRQKRWNSIFSNHENMKSSKFCNPAKFQLKQIRTVRTVFY